MRLAWLTLAVFTLWVAPESLRAGDAVPAAGDALGQVLEAKETPDLVRQIGTSDPAADAVRAQLIADPAKAAEAAAPFLDAAEKLGKRDGKLALGFADWLIGVVAEARKTAADDPELCHGLARAWLLRGRVGVALKETGDGTPWMEAASLLLERAVDEEDEPEPDVAGALAVSVLHEGAQAAGAPADELLARAATVAKKVLSVHGESEDVRRGIVDTCAATVRALAKVSPGAAARALSSYFLAFRPIAEPEDSNLDDSVAFNDMVSFATVNKLDNKVGYVTDEETIGDGVLTVAIPRTRRWRVSGDQVRETEVNELFFRRRVLAVQAYEWDGEYRVGKKGKTVKGDKLKALAKSKYKSLVSLFKVKKKKSPSRKQFNKLLPPGTGLVVEGVDKGDNYLRFSVFYVKVPKAKRTVRITTVMLIKTAIEDPEAQALLDSIRLTE